MPTPCELHVRARNISIHVAYGSALPLNPSSTIHGKPIPPSYTSVTVEQIVGNNEDLELDFVEVMERRHWEMHCTGSFYGARPTSNLLQAQRLRADRSPVSLTAIPTTSSLTTVSAGAKGHEYSNSSCTRKGKEKRQHPSQRLDPQRRSRKWSKDN